MKKRFLSIFLAVVMICSVPVVAGATGSWLPITQDVGSGYSVTNSTGSYLIGSSTIYKYSYTSASNSWQSIPYNTNFTGKRVFGGDDNGFYYSNGGAGIYKATYSATTSSWTDTLVTALDYSYVNSPYFSNATMYYSSTLGLIICFGNYTLKYQSGTLTAYTGSSSLVTNNNCKLMNIKRGGANMGIYLRNDTGIYYFSNNVWVYKASVNYTPATYDATVNSTCCDESAIYFVGGLDVVPGIIGIPQTSIYKFNPATGTISSLANLPTGEGRYDATCFFDSSYRLVVVEGQTPSTTPSTMYSTTWQVR